MLAAYRAAVPDAPARYHIGLARLRRPDNLVAVWWGGDGEAVIESIGDRAGPARHLYAAFRRNFYKVDRLYLVIMNSAGVIESGAPKRGVVTNETCTTLYEALLDGHFGDVE